MVCGNDGDDVEAPLRVPPRRGSEAQALVGRHEQPAQRSRHGRRIVARHERARLAIDDDVGHAADGARDHGHAGARSFEQRKPQTLASRRMHEQIKARQKRGQIGAKANQRDVACEPALGELGAQTALERALPEAEHLQLRELAHEIGQQREQP